MVLAVVFAALVSSQLIWVYPYPGKPAVIESLCRYADGVVLTVPGQVCPASD